jgi:hypothetical protein
VGVCCGEVAGGLGVNWLVHIGSEEIAVEELNESVV